MTGCCPFRPVGGGADTQPQPALICAATFEFSSARAVSSGGSAHTVRPACGAAARGGTISPAQPWYQRSHDSNNPWQGRFGGPGQKTGDLGGTGRQPGYFQGRKIRQPRVSEGGNPFVAHFFESVHVRRKRPGELLPAVSIKKGITIATLGQTPGSVVHTKRKVVLTVAAIDPKDGTVTVKDPDGTEETVKVDNSKYLGHVKPGDDLVVTVRQAVAISLDKD